MSRRAKSSYVAKALRSVISCHSVDPGRPPGGSIRPRRRSRTFCKRDGDGIIRAPGQIHRQRLPGGAAMIGISIREVSMSLRERLKDSGLFREQAFVGGSWIDAAAGATLAVIDPATGAEVGKVPALGAEETRQAIKAAEEAWPAWRALPSSERGRLLEEWCRLMLENIDDLALIMTMEQGKPLAESAGEIRYGAGFIKWFSEEARRLYGNTIPAPTPDRRILILKEPVGVSAAITPWNFPNAMITRKAGPALAAGCP